MTVGTGPDDLLASLTHYRSLTDKLECINKLWKREKKEKMGVCLLETEGSLPLLYTYQYELINYLTDPPPQGPFISILGLSFTWRSSLNYLLSWRNIISHACLRSPEIFFS
jgi:hypothetical protein